VGIKPKIKRGENIIIIGALPVLRRILSSIRKDAETHFLENESIF